MKITILTTFPEMFTPLHTSMLGRAEKAGILEIREVDIRAYSKNKHHNTDDAPFGGGAGMVMLAQPIVDAIRDVQGGRRVKRIYLSPRGETLTQKKAEQLAKEDELILLCGHYEGVDQRALDLCIDEEISIGDYVLTGGELGAMVLVDCVARLVPGASRCSTATTRTSSIGSSANRCISPCGAGRRWRRPISTGASSRATSRRWWMRCLTASARRTRRRKRRRRNSHESDARGCGAR